MHKAKVYTDRIMKAVREEAESVLTERLTRPVRIFARRKEPSIFSLNASSRTKFFLYEANPANVRIDKTWKFWPKTSIT